jgi:hypothetical protein
VNAVDFVFIFWILGVCLVESLWAYQILYPSLYNYVGEWCTRLAKLWMSQLYIYLESQSVVSWRLVQLYNSNKHYGLRTHLLEPRNIFLFILFLSLPRLMKLSATQSSLWTSYITTGVLVYVYLGYRKHISLPWLTIHWFPYHFRTCGFRLLHRIKWNIAQYGTHVHHQRIREAEMMKIIYIKSPCTNDRPCY